MAKIKLRNDKLDELRTVLGIELDAELARRIGVYQSSLFRVVSGTRDPGNKFIAGLLTLAGGEHWFEKLFTIVQDPK